MAVTPREVAIDAPLRRGEEMIADVIERDFDHELRKRGVGPSGILIDLPKDMTERISNHLRKKYERAGWIINFKSFRNESSWEFRPHLGSDINWPRV